VAINMVLYVNRYGWNKALNDAEWAFGLLWGLVEDKVMNRNGESENRTGRYAGLGGGKNNPWHTYGGRQQVPLGRGGKRRGGWT